MPGGRALYRSLALVFQSPTQQEVLSALKKRLEQTSVPLFPRHRLRMLSKLAEGAFGSVSMRVSVHGMYGAPAFTCGAFIDSPEPPPHLPGYGNAPRRSMIEARWNGAFSFFIPSFYMFGDDLFVGREIHFFLVILVMILQD